MARKLQERFAKERDLECRVYTDRIFGEEYVEIVDYIPSEDKELPGFVCNVRHLPRLVEALDEVKRFVSVGVPSTQCEGQGVFPL